MPDEQQEFEDYSCDDESEHSCERSEAEIEDQDDQLDLNEAPSWHAKIADWSSITSFIQSLAASDLHCDTDWSKGSKPYTGTSRSQIFRKRQKLIQAAKISGAISVAQFFPLQSCPSSPGASAMDNVGISAATSAANDAASVGKTADLIPAARYALPRPLTEQR